MQASHDANLTTFALAITGLSAYLLRDMMQIKVTCESIFMYSYKNVFQIRFLRSYNTESHHLQCELLTSNIAVCRHRYFMICIIRTA